MAANFSQEGHFMTRGDQDRGQPSPQETGQEPSGPNGENPATAGPGKTAVVSKTTENAKGHINPSAPEDANVTPGSIDQK